MRDSLPQIKTTITLTQDCSCGAKFEADATGTAALAMARVRHTEFIEEHSLCKRGGPVRSSNKTGLEHMADTDATRDLLDEMMQTTGVDYQHILMTLQAMSAWLKWCESNGESPAFMAGQLAGVLTAMPEEMIRFLQMRGGATNPFTYGGGGVSTTSAPGSHWSYTTTATTSPSNHTHTITNVTGSSGSGGASTPPSPSTATYERLMRELQQQTMKQMFGVTPSEVPDFSTREQKTTQRNRNLLEQLDKRRKRDRKKMK